MSLNIADRFLVPEPRPSGVIFPFRSFFARQVKRQQRLAAADAAPDLGSKAPLADADPDVSVGGEGLTVKDSCKTLPSLSDGSGDASPTAAAGSDGDGHVTAGDLEAGVAAEPAAAADGEKR